MDAIQEARERYAQMLREKAQLKSDALMRAFAQVPREAFLGPAPWRLLGSETDNPVHLYNDVLVAIDPTRSLMNGLPSFIARSIDALGLSAGERVVHVGCGTGYYSAVLANVVGDCGNVIALEIEPELAGRSRDNLTYLPQVQVVCANGSSYDPGPVDAIFINAGATHPCDVWLDSLRSGGRLVFPLTRSNWAGVMLKVTLTTGGYGAAVTSAVGIYPCAGAIDAEAEKRLGEALDKGGYDRVRCLRREIHEKEESCWLHGLGYCFSTLDLSEV
ncbi:MAG: protein-L-isoaspartate O-methyltransferase family protein [Candidatus Binataceae bacterium]